MRPSCADGAPLANRDRRRRAGGFTLVELLVAVGLMAVLAVLSWRGLETILQSRERLVVSSDELRSLTLALSQLDEDLKHAAAIRPLELPEPEISVERIGDTQRQVLVLVREVNRLEAPTRLQRVYYEVRNGVLFRGFTEWAEPNVDNSRRAGVGAIVWQPILANVAEIRIRGWVVDPDSTTPTTFNASGPGDGTRTWLDPQSLAAQLEMISAARQQQLQQVAKLILAARSGNSQSGTQTGTQTTSEDAFERKGLARRVVNGVELTILRGDGTRYVRIYPVVD